MPENINSPGDYPPIEGIESDKDSIGRGDATPIDGHRVVLTETLGEVKKD